MRGWLLRCSSGHRALSLCASRKGLRASGRGGITTGDRGGTSRRTVLLLLLFLTSPPPRCLLPQRRLTSSLSFRVRLLLQVRGQRYMGTWGNKINAMGGLGVMHNKRAYTREDIRVHVSPLRK